MRESYNRELERNYLITITQMKKLLFIVCSLLLTINTYAYTPTEFNETVYPEITKTSSFEVSWFTKAWDIATGKWVKIAVIDSFENNYYHGVWIDSLIWSDHNDGWIVWYAPDAEVIRYNFCTWRSCRYQKLIPILDKIKDRWDIKIVNISATYINKDFSSKLKELTDDGIMVVTSLPNKTYKRASLHCNDDSIICVWSYFYKRDWTITQWDTKYKSMSHSNILGKWYYPQMDKGNWTTHRRPWTSFATPQISSAIALMLEVNPDLTYKEIRETLLTTWTEVPNGDVVLNVHKALLTLDPKLWWEEVVTPEPIVVPAPIEDESTNTDNQKIVELENKIKTLEARILFLESILNKIKSLLSY